jgi:hypothetical protein
MIRLAGDQIGVEFLKPTTEKSKQGARRKLENTNDYKMRV